MADGDVRLRLNVDGIESIGGLRQAIKGTGKEIDALVLTTKGADKALEALNKRHADLKNTLTELTKGGLSETQKNFRGAQVAVLDFTRVMQDAPYGIRGVANNIEQLTQSFLQLRRETGSASGAIGAMFSTLNGPAGILLSVSLVSALATVFGDKLIPKIETAGDRMKQMVDNAKEIAKLGSEGLTLESAQRERGMFQGQLTDSQKRLKSLQEQVGMADEGVPLLRGSIQEIENERKRIEVLKKYIEDYNDVILRLEQAEIVKQRVIGQKWDEGGYTSKTLAGSQRLDIRNRASDAYRRDNLGSLKDRDTWNFGPQREKIDIPELKGQFTAFENSVMSGTNAMAGVISNRLGKAFADVFGGAQTLLGGLVQAMTQALTDFASKWALGTLFAAIGGPLGGMGGAMLAGIGAMRMSNGLTGAAVGKSPTVRIDPSAGSFRVRGRDLVYVTDSSRRAMAGVSY